LSLSWKQAKPRRQPRTRPRSEALAAQRHKEGTHYQALPLRVYEAFFFTSVANALGATETGFMGKGMAGGKGSQPTTTQPLQKRRQECRYLAAVVGVSRRLVEERKESVPFPTATIVVNPSRI
jgi:hypothetical protein